MNSTVQSLFNLNGKTAIVTGGASGIGLAISRLFAQQGAVVHILELNIDQAEREADPQHPDGQHAEYGRGPFRKAHEPLGVGEEHV